MALTLFVCKSIIYYVFEWARRQKINQIMRKNLLKHGVGRWLLLILALISSIPGWAAVGDEFVVDNLSYFVRSENTVSVYCTDYEMEYVTIPAEVIYNFTSYSVTEIISNAFRGCWRLTSVVIPETVTSIEDGAFCDCISLTSVVIPETVTSIGDEAFAGCRRLTSVVIPETVTSIGDLTFYNCSSLTSVVIPETVTSIGDGAFAGCSSLTSVVIPETVTSIGDEAFAGCRRLTSVVIPQSVTSIGECAFDCGIEVSKDNPNYSSLDGVLFNKKMTSLICCGQSKDGDYLVPETVTEICNNSFNCESLNSITISKSVTTIGESAFDGCYNLEYISVSADNSNFSSYDGVLFDKEMKLLIRYPIKKEGHLPKKESYKIPITVNKIGNRAFYNCRFREIYIPETVTEIGMGAFHSCSYLRSIFVFAETPPIISKASGYMDLVFSEVVYSATVYIPKGAIESYSTTYGWNDFNNFREMGVLDVSLSESNLSIEIGDTDTLTPILTKDGDVKIESETWSTSNAEVATVENGVVTAVSEGEAIITYFVIDSYDLSHADVCVVKVVPSSGISDINADIMNAPIEYYNLNGIRMNGDNLVPGIYIKRQGGNTEKILVK